MTAFSITTDDQTNLPRIEQAVTAAADVATDAALDVIRPAILKETPERTGDLKRSERTFQRGPFVGMIEARIFYASYVNEGTERTLASGRVLVQPPNPFIDRGVDASESAAAATFERTFDAEMERYGG